MTRNLTNAVKSAKVHPSFMRDIKATGSEKHIPGLFASDIDKAIFASIYVGWLIGNYGPRVATEITDWIDANGALTKNNFNSSGHISL